MGLVMHGKGKLDFNFNFGVREIDCLICELARLSC